MIHTWQKPLWAQFEPLFAAMPHAILLSGRRGIGKRDFARALAQAILCSQPQSDHAACGACPSCRWFEADSHPDFRVVQPQEGSADAETGQTGAASTQIKIDQIRDLMDFVNLTSHQAGARVVMVQPAEAMNVNAANALLKTLEEPPANTVLILVADRPALLPATILSRCRTFRAPAPEADEARRWLEAQAVSEPEQWLAFAGGAPLTAVELARHSESDALRNKVLGQLAEPTRMSALELAAAVEKLERPVLIDWLIKWVFDLVSARLTGDVRFYPARRDALLRLGAQAPMQKLLAYQKQLTEAAATATHPLNSLLFAESILLAYQQAVIAKGRR